VSRKRKKSEQTRQMSETEYRGYWRGHRFVEHAVDRENLKARERQWVSGKQRKSSKRGIDHTLRSGDVDSIEKLEFESQKAEREMRGTHGRIERMKLIERYEESEKAPK
jgi:hypothetical protein